MYENHTDKNLKPVACHFCTKTFDNKKPVMKHQKNSHNEKVRQCTYSMPESVITSNTYVGLITIKHAENYMQTL